MIHLETIERRGHRADRAAGLHALRGPDLRAGLPGRRHQADADGVVQTSLKPRCIGCSNCVLACPFGVPKYVAELDQMMKCDMCYDRTSVGPEADVRDGVPERALWFGTREEFAATRAGRAVNEWRFGDQYVAPRSAPCPTPPGAIDVVAAEGARPWQDDPFGLDEERGAAARCPSRSGVAAGLPAHLRGRGRGDPPRVRRGTSCSPPAASPPATSASRSGPRSGRSTPASPGRSSPSPRPRGHGPPLRLPDEGRPGDPRAPPRRRAAGLLPEVHAPRMRRLLPARQGRDGVPVSRGLLRRPHR